MRTSPAPPLRRDVVLCGEMFGLRVHRHRIFEVHGAFVMRPQHQMHGLRGARTNCEIGPGIARWVTGNYADHEDAADAMGIDWPMSRTGRGGGASSPRPLDIANAPWHTMPMTATHTTSVQLTSEQMADARAIGEALIASRKGTAKARAAALDAFRAANRASRERWGDDLHEVIKARGIAGATGGRA